MSEYSDCPEAGSAGRHPPKVTLERLVTPGVLVNLGEHFSPVPRIALEIQSQVPLTRKFVDWTRPLIPVVVDQLLDRFSVSGAADLRQVVVAFPSRHGLKRFDDLWVRRTNGKGHPPRRITVGELPELLYNPLRPFASDLVQKLAWGEAVRGLPKHKVELVLGHLPDDGDFHAWLSIGEVLWRTHVELAADGLSFGDVARRGAELPEFRESSRWQAMHEMQAAYLSTLDDLGMWDQQTARLVAIERHECQTDKEIILVGAADLNIALRQMLDQVANRVTAYVHAPPTLSDRFDSHGCLVPEAWAQIEVELSNDRVAVVDGPDDQAQEVVARLRQLDGRRRMDEITIGVPDERMVPVLRRVLGEVGVSCYRAIETTLKETNTYRLLTATLAWLEGQRPSQFAELVRHPAISAWISDQGVSSRWLAELDEFLAKHLQSRLGQWPASVSERYQALKRAYDLVAALMSSLNGESRLLGDWTEPISEFLLAVYGHREFDLDNPDDRLTVESCRHIRRSLEENVKVPELLMPAMAAHQALRLTLSAIGNQSIPPEGQLDGVELLGWLDLAQDDNPVVVLTSFNEGYVPSSVNSDLFLPNTLRQHLGLTDNARRYARDVHALQALIASRDNVSLIVGRRDVRREPLVPSRLLFATDAATIAARIRRFYSRQEELDDDVTSQVSLRPAEILTEQIQTVPPSRHRFEIPQPTSSLAPLKSMSVTAFKLYLACPYRFYLRHVLRLRSAEEDALEMTPPVFGTFLHEVLAAFGRHPTNRSKDEHVIRQSLLEQLNHTSELWFGSDPLPVVKIQLEQARRRLQAFANWQTEQNRLGWLIHSVEERYEMDWGRTGKIRVRGQIDRIDQHRDTGEFRILDYKTSDTAKKPKQIHRRKDQWVDLQLPLYRQLAWHNDISGNVALGYICMSREAEMPSLEMADWTDAELAEADDVSLDIVEAILRGEFWPMTLDKVREAPEFARICQEKTRGNPDEGDAEEDIS